MKELNEENIRHITDVLSASDMTELSDAEWELLQNTDSFHSIRPGHILTFPRQLNTTHSLAGILATVSGY